MNYIKTIFLFVAIFFLSTVNTDAAIYYIAPNGNDNTGNGSITTPWASIEKLSSMLQSGDTGYVRGGTYRSITPNDENKFKINNLNGIPTNLIKIWAYPGEKPVFNLDNIPATQSGVGFYVSNSAYIHLKGLRVTGLKQCTSGCSVAGMILYRVDNSIVELFEIDNIEGYGLYLQGPQNPGGDGSDNNLIKNVDVHHIGDRYSGWGGANGFNITGGDLSNNNVFDGCRIWWSSDDGFDFFGTNIYATIKNSWSFWNGYVPGTFNTAGDGYGFKLGPAGNNPPYNELKRVLTNNLAFENRIGGFDQNSGTDNTMRYRLHNNTSFGNGQFSYFFGANTSIPQDFKNNIAVGGSINGNEILSGPNVANNSWNGNVTANNSDFVSVSARSNPNCLLATVTDTNCPNGPRQADGSLPDMNFLKLTSTSDLINTGTNVGLPYSGSAPDIGAFEYGGTSTTPTDTTAPTVPTNLSATGTTQTQTTLSWSASTDAVGVSGYRVFRNGTQIATSATTSYTATALTASTTYSFTVSAYDAAGNVSTQSTAVSVTTASNTNTAPTSNAGADQTITLPTSSVTLTGSGTDVGGSISSYSWTKVSTLAGTITSPSSASTTITGLVQGTHTFRLTVTDNGGLTASDNVVIIVNPAVTTGGIFVAGDRVQVYGGSVRVRSGGTTSASSLGTQTSGKLGTVSRWPSFSQRICLVEC
jgi:chitodextrinase